MILPGLYLLLLLVSLGGVVACDLRWNLALRSRPWRTLFLVVCGAAFLLVWDLVGIARGVFVKGDGPWLLGVDLAPHLTIEEPIFLIFLAYLTVVLTAAVQRLTSSQRREEQ